MYTMDYCISLKMLTQPWQVWLSGLSIGLQAERSQVQFPVRAHAWIAGQVNWSMYLLHIDISFLLFLPPFPTL